ncbi:G-protein coupled receptor [Oopsacas minuta]|uniref:G-protein coupled receptor n=1 Tax=Oopsacas minuta TaxID=111878 RepID=A0AAV7JKN4_9METZ|nr:G-protein coupled receptor [Oopsacas minuta]
MNAGLAIAILLFHLELCFSQCPIYCITDSTAQCYITSNSPELNDNWIESCHDTSTRIQFLKIFITNYPYATLPINSPGNFSLNNIIIYFYQPQSLTLISSTSNSNISSLTLSGENPFTNGVKEFLSYFSNLISLYILSNTQLQYLEDDSFISLTRLQLLTVERVGIDIIGDNLFVGLSELVRLDWTDSATSLLTSSAFSHLTSLQYLNLQNNKIASINCDLFQRISNLEQINLAGNVLCSLPSQSFQQMPNLILLSLKSNPIVCDCNMFWLEYAEYFFNLTVLWPCSGNTLSPVQQASNESYQNVLVCSNGTNTSMTNITQPNPQNTKLNTTVNTSNISVPVINNTIPVSNISLCYNITVLKTFVNTTAICQSFLVNTTAPTTNYIHNLPSANICPNTNNFTCNSPSQPCQHTCTNSPTGFNCSCDNGFYLEPDGFSCTSNIFQCPAVYSYCSDSSCCISSLYSCPLNLSNTVELEMGVTVLQASPLQEVVNRSILLSSVDDQISLNLSVSVNCQVTVLSCEVDWQECYNTVMNFTMLESFSLEFSLPSADRDSTLHYLLLSIEDTEDDKVKLYERLLVIIQNSNLPTLYTRSLVRASTVNSSQVLIGAAVSSLEASLCSDVCPNVSVSLFSVGLIEVDISDWEGVSIVVDCIFLPSQYWMSYNSYLFSIEWKNVSSELNGRYELRVNVTELVEVTEFSIDYPAADNACEGRLEMGVYWDSSSNGSTISIPCSDLFGPHNATENVEDPDQLLMERSCESNLEWSGITNECIFFGSITKILSFTAVITPSQLIFSLLYYPTVDYTYLCLNHTRSLLTGLGIPILHTQRNSNILSIWFDATNVNFDQINSFPSPDLSANLSACLTDFSLHFITQSTVCDCITSPDGYIQELQHTVLCTVPACDCKNSSCSCNIGLYGDGSNCSFDTDGDGLPDNLVICGDSLCVDMCPNQSRCIPQASEVSEECEDVCILETDSLFNITWPCTAGGANREVLCPTEGNIAYRQCFTDGTWGNPDTSSCVSDAYATLEKTDELETLLDVLLAKPPMMFGDVIITLNILEEKSSNLDMNTMQMELDNVFRIISNLVSDSNINLLQALQDERPVIESLLNSTDKFVENLAAQNCTTTSIQYDRVRFNILSVGDTALGTSVSAGNIMIGEDNQSPSVSIMPNGEVSCTSFVVIENLASIVTDTSSLKFGSSGLNISVFEEIIILPTLVSLHLYSNNQVISEKGGDPLATLNFPIDTSSIDLDVYRVEVAVGFLDTQSEVPSWQGGGIGLVSGSLESTILVEVTHLTSFAAILGINSISPTSTVFPIITYIGSTIAIICLVLSMIVYVIFEYRLLKKIYHFILFNLTLSLLLCYVVFMLGVELAYANFLQFIPCKIISYLISYLILVTFLWMLMGTIVIFMMTKWPYYKINVKYNILFFCISWLGPLIYTLITLTWFHAYSISPPFDTTVVTSPVEPMPGVCWIHTDVSTNISTLFVAIPAVIIAVSISCIVIVVCVLLKCVRRDEPEISRSTRAIIRMLITISILYPLIFIGWSFGLLAIAIKLSVLFWFFAIFASAQGIIFLLVILVRSGIYLSMAKLLRRVIRRFRPESQPPVFTQSSLARLLDDDVLRRSTLALAKQQGLISPIVEIDELMVFLEEKPWQSQGNPAAIGEVGLEYLRNQLAPGTESEKPGLSPLFEITQLMTFLEESALEERTKNTVITDLSALDSSIFFTDPEAIKAEDTHSRDIIYQGNDPFADTIFISESDANIQLPKVKYTDEVNWVEANPDTISYEDSPLRYQAEHKNIGYDIPKLLEIEVSLLELQKTIAQVDNASTTRIAPNQVIEIQPDEFPTLKSVIENPRTLKEAIVPPPILEHEFNVIQDKEGNIAFDNITSQSSFMNSRISTTQLPKREIVDYIPPPQEDPTESLDFLIDQIDDLLTDIDSPLTKL